MKLRKRLYVINQTSDSRIRGASWRAATHGFTIVELLVVIVVIGILAAITLVAYNGIQNRARVASVSSALNQASKKLALYQVENGSYPAALGDVGIADSSNASYQYSVDNTANPKAFCITATNNTIIYKISESTAPTAGGCNGHTWDGGVVMTNLVVNGDFSSGASGWYGYDSTVSASNNIMYDTIASSPGYSNGFIYRNDFTILANHIHYYSAKLMVNNSVATQLRLDVLDSMFASVNSPLAGQWYALSGTKTYLSDLTNMAFRIRHFYPDKPTAANKVMQIKEVVAIDLTAAFGAGNEPTKAQMDAILGRFTDSWFGGTVTADTRGLL